MSRNFYRPIPHGTNRLHTEPLPPRRRPPLPTGLAIGTLNIQDVQDFGLAQAIRTVERRGFDMMILTKTKISTTIYCRNRLVYDVTCSTARPTSAGGSQGGVILVTRERPVGWGIESTRYHGPSVVRWELVTGIIRTPLVSAYLTPSTIKNPPDLEEALKRFKDPIILGDLNMDLNKARSPRSQLVADLLAEYGLIDLVWHFHQRRRFRNLKTWYQIRRGTALRPRCYHIIGTDRQRFELVGIHNMQKFSSDHFALSERIIQRPTLCHTL